MMVRVAGLAAQVRNQVDEKSLDGQSAGQQLQDLHGAISDLVEAQYQIFTELTALLGAQGVHMITDRRLTKPEGDFFADYFERHVLPALTPQAIDPAHPFPFIANQGSGILFSLVRIADDAPVNEMVLIPPAMPRYVRLPGLPATWIGIEELIRRKAATIFPGFASRAAAFFGYCATAILKSRKMPRIWCAISALRSSAAAVAG